MSTTLFEQYGGGQLVLTRCANAAGEGTRLELFAAAGPDGGQPVEIRDPAVADRLAARLRTWAIRRRRELSWRPIDVT